MNIHVYIASESYMMGKIDQYDLALKVPTGTLIYLEIQITKAKKPICASGDSCLSTVRQILFIFLALAEYPAQITRVTPKYLKVGCWLLRFHYWLLCF